MNLSNNRTPSITQHFIEIYKQLESQYQGEANAEKLYKEAIEMMSKERATRKEDDFISLSTEFKEAQNKDSKVTKVSLKNIFES